MIFDRRLFLPALMQVIAMLAPFFYLRAALGHGTADTVQGEAILSIVGFAAVAIDFSASTFLAKSQARLLRSGALLSILLGRLSIAGILLLFSIAFIASIGASWQDSSLIALFCMLLGLALDPSWIYIGRGHLWIPAAIGAVRFGTAALLTASGMQPVLALAVSFLSSSLFFVLFSGIRLYHFARISHRLFFRILRRYYKPTITESITAVFSRLDVAVAAALLQPSEALIYAVSRKLIVGLQSVAFAGARIFYLERDLGELKVLRRTLLKYTSLTFFLGLPLSMVVATFWFNLPMSIELWGTLALLSILIFLGYKKTLIQFGHLYVHRKFSSDLLYSMVSMFVFAALCSLLAKFGSHSAIAFALVRIVPDALYTIMAQAARRGLG